MSFVNVLLLSLIASSNGLQFINDWHWRISEDDPIGTRPVSRISPPNSKDYIKLSAIGSRRPLRYGVKGVIGMRYFTVESDTGIVKLRTQFDREVDDRYKVKFYATDGTDEIETEATIYVTDVNDNAPMFQKHPYRKSIPESSTLGREVLRLRATDMDSGRDGRIKYSLEDEFGLPFDLHPWTGILTLRTEVDYEDTQVYQFNVRATDLGETKQLSSVTPVIIHITDVQDTDPVFYGLPYNLTIPEDTPEATSILTLQAEDGDRDNPNTVIFSIISGDDTGRFIITGNDLRVANGLDRDVKGFDGVYTLLVKATEQSLSAAFSLVAFDVTVTDVDDNRPVWNQSRFEISTREDTRIGTKLVTMRVKDLDQGVNSEIAVFVDAAFSAYFAVTPALIRGSAEVLLILNQPLDYEERKRIKLKIFANSTWNPSHYSVTDVIINIENVNDNRPYFPKPVYSVDVPENVSRHSLLLKVEGSDEDYGEFGRLTYSITDPASKFGLNSETGEIYLMNSLDREQIHQYSILISASDGVEPAATATVMIRVTDVNDNAPQFGAASYAAEIAEDETPLNPILIVWASDADAPPSNLISYGIIKTRWSRHFKIRKTFEGYGEIFVRTPIDFEKLQNGIIKLQVMATDSGDPPLNKTVPLVVTVSDVNDNAPVFSAKSSRNISFPEDLGEGEKVGEVEATDIDRGSNGRVRYFVRDGRDDFDHIFRLNEYTGDITIKSGASPDYETMSRYKIVIVAEDHGSPPKQASHRVTISLEDVNDNPPIFSQNQYVVTFLEGATPLISVSATDDDEGTNADIFYSITKGNDNEGFVINSSSGKILALSPLDYESTSGRLILEVTASDRSEVVESKFSSVVEVVINILDVNDNAPVFEITKADDAVIVPSYDVTEGVEGQRIGRFSATDDDEGENGFVTYSICKGNDGDLFSISHSEGDLRIQSGRTLDREETEVHHLTICATDSGDVPLNSTLAIRINVLDVNDNAPIFTRFHSTVRVREDLSIRNEVSRVHARDIDKAEYGRVTYEITSGDPHGYFRIHTWDGQILLVKSLDRESINEYDLEITAKDSPESRSGFKSTTKVMKILVTDVNDNPPQFVGDTPYRGRINENSPPGTSVEIVGDQIRAVDSDLGENAVVHYSLIRDDISFVNGYSGGHRRSFFSIDSNTGEISMRTYLDREALASDVIKLVVRAQDREERHSDVTVIIQILDVNDNSPRFRSKSVRVGVREDRKSGFNITTVVATDEDSGDNARVSYAIRSGSYDKFAINPSSGVIRIASAQSLDRERKPVYELEVVAMDNGDVTSRTSTCTVTIQVEDVNDERPKFHDLEVNAKIKENSPSGTAIATLRATDPDSQPLLRYTISSFDAYDAHGRPLVPNKRRKRSKNNVYDEIKGWFELNELTGVVSTSNSKPHLIDREICSKVQMSVSVRDNGSVNDEVEEALNDAIVTVSWYRRGENNTAITVIESVFTQITIEDENDNSPVFVTSNSDGDVIGLGSELIVNITEEAIIGSELLTLEATDKDSGDNGKVIYEIIERRNVQLRDAESGTLTVSSRIDRESLVDESGQAWINLTVNARDLGAPESRTTRLKVALRVMDVNDNEPRFDRKRYEVSVAEDVITGAELVTMVATDADSGSFGSVVYSLKGGERKFSIDPKTGVVSLRKTLDREAKSSYQLVVVATDNEEGPEYERRTVSVPLVVLLTDVNDCPPTFVEPRTPKTYSTQENAEPGSLIAVVSAEDLDEGLGSQITYSLKKDSTSEFFSIQPSSGHLTIRRSLNALPRHLGVPKLEVIATDGGGLFSNMTLFLDIADINDHAPLFTEPGGKEVYIDEEDDPGTYVGEMLATDSDSGMNGVVRYSFCDATNNEINGAFIINEVTGRIVTSKRLDREKVPTYPLLICANDLGEPTLSNSASVTVKLRDINDNEPEFPKSRNAENGQGAYQELVTTEDLGVRKSVGHVLRATDLDVGANAHVFYHLLSVTGTDGEEEEGLFSLQKKSGRIVLEKPLDREKIDKYVLIIKASNDENYIVPDGIVQKFKKETIVKMGSKRKRPTTFYDEPSPVIRNGTFSATPSPLLAGYHLNPSKDSSLIEVAIVIDDVNDEPPVFEEERYIAAADNEAKPGASIVTVKARDDDVDDIVTYSIVSSILTSADNTTEQNVLGAFRIHPQDGAITTSRTLKGYTGRYFKLEIEAVDKVRHRSSAYVFVYLLQAEDRIKFVVNSPPGNVRKKKEEFQELLESITEARVILDGIDYHVTDVGHHDNQRSDVTMRVFDPTSLQQVSSGDLKKTLEKSRGKMERIFGVCTVFQDTNQNPASSSSSLQFIIVIMLAFLFLVVLLFSVLYYHMQKRYKREIQALASATLSRKIVKQTPTDEVIIDEEGPATPSAGTFPRWKEEYYKMLSEQSITEEAEYFTDSDREVRRRIVPARNSRSRPRSSASNRGVPHEKRRSRSEIVKSGDKMSRSKTDACIPRGYKLPVTKDSIQEFQEASRNMKSLRKSEKRQKLDGRSKGHDNYTDDESRAKRLSLKQDTSSLKRSGNTSSNRRGTSSSKRGSKSFKHDTSIVNSSSSSKHSKSEDSRSDASTVKEVIVKTKDAKSLKREKCRQSPELSLHSGGTSEEFSRKHSITLHGSDMSELEHDYLESDDSSESSPSHVTTSSIANINAI